ncbi:MAG: ion channel [Hyphomicrobiales bacterium]|nr:ion channel [Hyphomicrobiales bacterium]
MVPIPNETLRHRVERLYYGSGETARVFRIAMLVFEVAVIGFFIAATFLRGAPWLHAVEIAIGALLIVDLAARLWIADSKGHFFSQVATWADIAVIASLFAPLFTDSLVFLRALRAVRLFRSYQVVRELRENFAFFERNRDAIEAGLNLSVFLFVMSAIVYVSAAPGHPKILNFLDAMYFTLSTLTTTGFGDIVLEGWWGRVLSIAIMIFGVGLFLRLVQTLFRPSKVRHECPTCNLLRHEVDAVHCKRCGTLLHLRSDGDET